MREIIILIVFIIVFSNICLCKDKKLNVMVVQVKLFVAFSKDKYEKKIYSLIEKGEFKNIDLVIFPEDIGTLLLATRIKDMIFTKYIFRNIIALLKGDLGILLKYYSDKELKQTYLDIFSKVARKYKVYIVAGSICSKVDDKIYNESYVFDRNGKILGYQRKLHPVDLEIKWGISGGKKLNIFEIDKVKVGVAICADGYYKEVGKKLKDMSAELIIQPSAHPYEYKEDDYKGGVWRRCQENNVYGIECCLVGRLFNLRLNGKSKICAPRKLTKDNSGILIQTKSIDKEEIIYYELKFVNTHNFF